MKGWHILLLTDYCSILRISLQYAELPKFKHKFRQDFFARFLTAISHFDQPAVKLYLFTLSAVTAPITAHLHTAGLTAFSEYRLVFVLISDRVSKAVIQVKMYRLSPKAHTRLSCLLRLDITLQLIEPSVLDKAPPCSAEYKCHIIIHAFLPQELHPIIMTRSWAVIVFAVT